MFSFAANSMNGGGELRAAGRVGTGKPVLEDNIPALRPPELPQCSRKASTPKSARLASRDIPREAACRLLRLGDERRADTRH